MREAITKAVNLFEQICSSELFIALIGVVIGGAITIASTTYFEWRRELSHRRSLATALSYKIMLLTSELGNIRNQVCGAIADARASNVDEINFWASVQALIGVPNKGIEILADELGWMHQKDHVELSMDVIQLIRGYNLVVAMINRYNASREEIEALAAEHANFQITPNGIVGQVAFDVHERPHLFGLILTTNKLLLELEDSLNRTFEPVPDIIGRLNAAMPQYFPKKYFKLNLNMVQQQ